MDQLAADLLSLCMPLLRLLPPWLLIASLTGLIGAASFFLLAGRGPRSLPTYLVLGLAVAPLWQQLALGLPGLPFPLTIGETGVLAVLLGTWLFLAMARALRL